MPTILFVTSNKGFDKEKFRIAYMLVKDNVKLIRVLFENNFSCQKMFSCYCLAS